MIIRHKKNNNNNMIIKKLHQNGHLYDYDDNKNLWFNPLTNKWVVRLRFNKGKAKGKAIGQAKGKAIGKAKGKAIGKAKGKAKGQAIGKAHAKITDSEIFYYKWQLPELSHLQPIILERICFFLFQIERKYQILNYLSEKNIDVFEAKKDPTTYFTIRQLNTILTEKNKYAFIKLLEDNGYITCEYKRVDTLSTNKGCSYLNKELSYHIYKPTQKLLEITKTQAYIQYLTVNNSILKYYQILEKALGDYLPIYRRLYNTKFNIQYSDFETIILNKYKSYKQEKEALNITYVTEKEYLNQNRNLFNIMMEWNDGSKYSNLHFFKIDSFSGRVHSIFTYMCSELVATNTAISTELDLKQSQMVLLAQLLFDNIGQNSFTNDINNGVDVYNKLSEYNGINNRNAGKKQMFQILFGYWKKNTAFSKLYPDADDFIKTLKNTYNAELHNYYKKKGIAYKKHAILAKMLQTIELDIFQKIWKAITMNKEVVMATRHDSIVVSKEHADNSLKIMQDVMEQNLSVRFEIRVK